MLVLHANQVVTIERLIEAAWDGMSPATARTQVHGAVSALRRALRSADAAGTADGPLVTRGDGYLLRIGTDGSDLAVFLDGVARAEGTADPATAIRELSAALDAWRGRALDGIRSRVLEAEADRLEQARLRATQKCARLELSMGRIGEAAARLARLTELHPLHEGLRELELLALYRSGRRADALTRYRLVRQQLVDELGIEPGPALRELHQRMLRDEPALLDAAAPRPAQLPAGLTDFTGRQDVAKEVRDLLVTSTRDGREGDVVVCVVTGIGGIGKTSLAVHVAHEVREHFPDGQLYLDLRGTGGRPPPTGTLLARVLADLGVDPPRIPADQDALAARYRSLLAVRRMLLVLDDAHDAEQVRPLLPGTASCAVLVTSRRRLTGLPGEHAVDVDVLAPEEARALFARILGDVRVAAEPSAVDAVLAACGGIPLALRIAAARLVARPGWRIADLAARLADQRRRLAELRLPDLAMRSSFATSYRALPKDADPARAFRLLGLAPGPGIGLPAAAALLALPQPQAEAALEALVDARLLESPAAGRYRLHDLLAVYATEEAEAEEPDDARAAAVTRLLRWYLHAAAQADLLLDPRVRTLSAYARPAVPRPPIGSYVDAVGWFGAELDNLVAAVTVAHATGAYEIAWQLAAVLYSYLDLRCMWAEMAAVSRTGLAAARTMGDRPGEGHCLIHLGVAVQDRDPATAEDCFRQAWAIGRELDSPTLETVAQGNLGNLHREAGRFDESVACFQDTLAIAVRTGNRAHEARSLASLSQTHNDAGRYAEALGLSLAAVEAFRVVGDRLGEGISLFQRGRAEQGLGRYPEAVETYRAALAAAEETSATEWQGRARLGLGDALHELGRGPEARRSWQAARRILEEIEHPCAATAAARLAG